MRVVDKLLSFFHSPPEVFVCLPKVWELPCEQCFNDNCERKCLRVNELRRTSFVDRIEIAP